MLRQIRFIDTKQRVFKLRQDGKAPKSGVPLICLHHEKLALITIGMLLNALEIAWTLGKANR